MLGNITSQSFFTVAGNGAFPAIMIQRVQYELDPQEFGKEPHIFYRHPYGPAILMHLNGGDFELAKDAPRVNTRAMLIHRDEDLGVDIDYACPAAAIHARIAAYLAKQGTRHRERVQCTGAHVLHLILTSGGETMAEYVVMSHGLGAINMNYIVFDGSGEPTPQEASNALNQQLVFLPPTDVVGLREVLIGSSDPLPADLST